MANIVTDRKNCTENSGSTYSTAGVPLTSATVFTKTFTVVSGYVFNKAPSINFSEVSDPSSYNVVITDTGSVVGGNLTVRSFAVKYKYPLKLVTTDIVNFTAKADLNISASSGKIYSYAISEANVPRTGQTREVRIYGDEGATLTFDVKNASNNSIRGGAGTVTIPSGGVYYEDIIFPASSTSTTYNVILTQINNSFLTMTSPQTVSLAQYANTTVTFSLTESSSSFIVSGTNKFKTGIVGDRSAELELTQGSTTGIWAITSQSSVISLKNNAVLDANDWTGTTTNNTNALTGGSLVTFTDLERVIHATTSHPSSSSTAYTGDIVQMNGNFTTTIKVGMRATGSGITRSGNTSLIVTQVSNPAQGVTIVKFNQTVGGTVGVNTTLTFHSVMHVSGQVAVNNFGTSNQTCSLDAANVVAFNQAPTASSQATISATRGQAKEVTLAANDPEGDALTFTITKLPTGGTLAYTNQNNESATITCSGQTSQTIVLGNSRVVAYTSGNAEVSSSPQTLQFKANDGQQDSNIATLTFNLS